MSVTEVRYDGRTMTSATKLKARMRGTRQTARNRRSAKSRRSNMGCSARRSIAAKTASRTAQPISEPRVTGWAQPRPGPSTMARTNRATPRLKVMVPGQSKRGPGVGVMLGRSGVLRSTRTETPASTRKIERHPQRLTRAPPNVGPKARPAPRQVPKRPNALPRAGPSNAWARMAVMLARAAPLPKPAIARARSSSRMLLDRPETVIHRAKNAMPQVNIRRCPTRSASDPMAARLLDAVSM